MGKQRVSVAKPSMKTLAGYRSWTRNSQQNTQRVEQILKAIYEVYPNSQHGDFPMILAMVQSC